MIEPGDLDASDDHALSEETAYLLRSPENARRLLAAIQNLEQGGGVVHDPLWTDESS